MKGFKNSTKMICEPLAMAEGGVVDRRMVESTSARPRTVPLREEVPTAAERGAIQRGNRAASLEASESAVMSPRVRKPLAVQPVKKSLGGIMEMAASGLLGGVAGLYSTAKKQKQQAEEAAAAKVPITAAKPTDPMAKDPQQLKRGGAVKAKGVPVASRAPLYGRK